MTRLTKQLAIDASPERVWTVLGDLSATPNWLPGTVSARIDGSTRVCMMADGDEVLEQIDNYSTADRTYRWRHLRVPLPVRDSHGTFSVVADGDVAMIVLETDFEPLDPGHDPEVTAMIDGAYQESLESLRRFIEKGTRWNDG
jgi:hypothetical protein